jgi:branched-chain amino acid transport system ATP-binding protein
VTIPALRTAGLHKSFGSLVVAQDVAIALPQGARYALIGPNGAGKTTLINLITGALRPDASSGVWRAPSRSTRCSPIWSRWRR